MKRITAACVLLCLLLAPCALADDAGDYRAANSLLRQERYAEASEAFRQLGAYEDASVLAMYSAALAAGEAGRYTVALQNLQSLSGFRDAAWLVPYYSARAMEDMGRYEEARDLLTPISLFRDSAERLAGYPRKINERDYTAASALEASGKLEEARAAFLALGDYSDSAARAAAVQQAIYARDYAAAGALENAGKLEEARAAFLALGAYSDSAARAAAVLEAIHVRDYAKAEALQTNGNLADAYDAFVALRGYGDSAARAAAIHDPAIYEKGLRAAKGGNYKQAYEFFSSLGSYEDSERKAYVFSVSTFATDTKPLGAPSFAFKFEGVWGVANWDENVILASRWADVSAYQSNGLAIVQEGQYSKRYGCIDRTGSIAIQPVFIELGNFGIEGLAKARTKDGYGYIDANGTVIIPCAYEDVSRFEDGLCVAASKSGNHYTFALFDTIGQKLTEGWRTLGNAYNTNWNSNYDNSMRIGSTDVHSGRILVQNTNGQWGYLSTEGTVAIEPEFTSAKPFSEDLAAVMRDDKYGYLNPQGETVIPFVYADAMKFADGRASVYIEGDGWHVINRDGAKIYFVDNSYDEAQRLFAAGSFAEAAEAFAQAGDEQMANEARYRLAETMIASQPAEARAIFTELGDYGDSKARIPETHYAEAEALLASGDYDGAIAAFGEAGSYGDAAERIPQTWYTKGEALFAAADYDGAAAAFKKAGKYNDATERVRYTWYAKGEALLAAADYDGAATAFGKAGDYNDAPERILEANYLHAGVLTADARYAEAYALYQILRGYKDVDAILSQNEELRKVAAEQYRTVGSIVTFGSYEQDNDKANGAEPIEWIVLDTDGKKSLLISRHGLDAVPYNRERTDITWEKCTLRAWLNQEFLSSAFTPDEQKALVTTTVDNSKKQGYSEYKTKGGNNTKGKIFLLSYAEAWRYFEDDAARKCAPTAYAVAKGTFTSDSQQVDGRPAGWWWLRSPGDRQRSAALVDRDGSLFHSSMLDALGVVRPALWVNLELIF